LNIRPTAEPFSFTPSVAVFAKIRVNSRYSRSKAVRSSIRARCLLPIKNHAESVYQFSHHCIFEPTAQEPALAYFDFINFFLIPALKSQKSMAKNFALGY